MLYAMGEIIAFLLIAALIGGLIGSVLCRAKARRDVELRVEQAHRTHGVELSQIRARLDDRNVEIVNLNDELAEAQGRLRSVEAELAAIAIEPGAGEASDALIEELRGQMEEAAARAVAAEHARDAALREASEAHQAAIEATAQLPDEDLESQLAARDRAIRDLEQQVSDLRHALSESPDHAAPRLDSADVETGDEQHPEPESEAAPRDAALAGEPPDVGDDPNVDAQAPAGQLAMEVPPEATTTEVARARVADIATRIQGDHQPVDDDLTRIRGIGPKINGMLTGMGITSYRQIAGFTPEDVRVVSQALESFPDRISRDDWMSSAAALHEAKYGESLD